MYGSHFRTLDFKLNVVRKYKKYIYLCHLLKISTYVAASWAQSVFMLEMNDWFVAACVSSQAQWNDSAAQLCVYFFLFLKLLFIYCMWQQFPSSQNPLPSSQGQYSCLIIIIIIISIKLCTWSAQIYWIVQGCQNPGRFFIITDTCSLLQAWIWFAFPNLCSWYLHELSLLLNCRQIYLNRISSQAFDDWKV